LYGKKRPNSISPGRISKGCASTRNTVKVAMYTGRVEEKGKRRVKFIQQSEEAGYFLHRGLLDCWRTSLSRG
jgi:hypothetical protein